MERMCALDFIGRSEIFSNGSRPSLQIPLQVCNQVFCLAIRSYAANRMSEQRKTRSVSNLKLR